MGRRIALVCTVWGAEFTEFFCEYCLATLLGPSGLERAAKSYDFTLLLYTSETDFTAMRAHRNFARLATLIDIRPVLLETLPSAARRGHWFQWHHALLDGDEFSSFILLIPDCLYANDAIVQIADALQTSDIIYYCIPQAALEPLRPHLEEMASVAGTDPSYSYFDFSQRDIATLFVKFINPRYAVALDKPEYFVTHPEFALRPTPGQIELQELSCHALAVSRRATSVSYSLNSPSRTAKNAFLGLLAVGAEYSLKYLEQYFRWPSSRMQLSRFATLAKWSHNYFEPGATEYTKTQTQIAVAGIDAATSRRTAMTHPRLKYARTVTEYYSVAYAIYDGPARGCRSEVRRAIALAMSLPGFRKAFMSERGPVTVFLPTSSAAAQVLRLLYAHGDPRAVARFMLMHVVPGRLMLKPEQRFVFETAAGRPNYRPRLRIIDPELARTLTQAVTGRILAPPTHVSDEVIAYMSHMQYGPAKRISEELSKADGDRPAPTRDRLFG